MTRDYIDDDKDFTLTGLTLPDLPEDEKIDFGVTAALEDLRENLEFYSRSEKSSASQEEAPEVFSEEAAAAAIPETLEENRGSSQRANSETGILNGLEAELGITEDSEKEKDVPEIPNTAEALPEETNTEEDFESSGKNVERVPRRRGGTVALLCVIGVLLLAAAAGFFLYQNLYLALQSELGTGLPEASYFMRDGSQAEYIDAPEISLKEEGLYLLTLKTNVGKRKVGLIVKDDTAPIAQDAELSIVKGTHIDPCDVLTTVYDASPWISRWVQAPDYEKLGTQSVSVELSDSRGNSAVIPASLEILSPVRSLTLAKGADKPSASEFLVQDGAVAWIESGWDAIDWETPGTYPLTIITNGLPYECELTITE